MQWVSVAEKLPEKGMVVLIYASHHVSAGWLTDDNKYPFAFVSDDETPSYDSGESKVCTNAWGLGRVTHWMPLPDYAPGYHLNPQWVEWLMGWPEGQTDLLPLAMDRFRSWQQQHGVF